MQTLEVTKESALKAYESANRKGRQLLENLYGPKTFVKDIKERVQSFDDALSVSGINHFDEIDTGNVADDVAANAYRKLIIIARALNEGWEPDWNNPNEYKYYPWQKYSGSGFVRHDFGFTYTTTYVGSRLCYKSRELALYAGKQFESIYNQFLK